MLIYHPIYPLLGIYFIPNIHDIGSIYGTTKAMKYYFFILCFLLLTIAAEAQSPKKQLKKAKRETKKSLKKTKQFAAISEELLIEEYKQKQTKLILEKAKAGEYTAAETKEKLREVENATSIPENSNPQTADTTQSGTNISPSGTNNTIEENALRADTYNITSDTTKTGVDLITDNLQQINTRLSKIEEATVSQENKSKYTLDPDSTFFGFSTGANFGFVDGIDDASLFLDLTGNLGKILNDRLTAEVAVLSGKFSPGIETRSAEGTISELLSIEQLSDSTSQFTSIEFQGSVQTETEQKFTRALIQVNYRIAHRARPKQSSKLFLSFQSSFNRVQFNLQNIQTADTAPDTVISIIDRPVSSIRFNPNIVLEDTSNIQITQDRISFSLGAKLFKGTEKFDFFVGAYLGYTFVNELNSEGRLARQSTTLLRQLASSRSPFDNASYLIQASILEKKVIGAKIGFELGNRFIPNNIRESNEAPDFYFFIAKQFSMQEFFKLFTPG